MMHLSSLGEDLLQQTYLQVLPSWWLDVEQKMIRDLKVMLQK